MTSSLVFFYGGGTRQFLKDVACGGLKNEIGPLCKNGDECQMGLVSSVMDGRETPNSESV